MRTASLAMAALAVLASAASADTITVCWDGTGDYLTIQAGIDAASPGDEVVVCDGVYTGIGNRDIDFRGKAITVRSENGPEACIIDCEFSGRGFYFQTGETRDSVLDGFTIRNGWAISGGAIKCYAASPTVSNMILINNHATTGGGGAIKCSSGSGPLIVNCIIGRNYAAEAGGGERNDEVTRVYSFLKNRLQRKGRSECQFTFHVRAAENA